MFKKNTWVVGLLMALAIMFVGCVEPIAEEGGEEVELVNLQELIKDAPDGLISDWGASVFAGTPFMKCGPLDISIITEGGVKKLKLDGMTQTWGEGLDIRHAATAEGNTGVGYKAGDEIYIKGKTNPANDGLLVNASGGGYAKVDNLGPDFDSTVTLTQDDVTAIKSGNPQTIRLHYDSGAARIGTIILEQIIIKGKRAAGEGPEPPPDYSVEGSNEGAYNLKALPAVGDGDLYIDLNPAEISILSPLGHFPVAKINAGATGNSPTTGNLTVTFDWNTQGIYIPFDAATKSIISNAAKAGYTIKITVDGSANKYYASAFRFGFTNGEGSNWDVSNLITVAAAATLTTETALTVNLGRTLNGIVFQARPSGANEGTPITQGDGPFTLTINSIKIAITANAVNTISSISLGMNAPTAGLKAYTSTSGTGWTGAVTWVPALPADGKWQPSTTYLAKIAITPAAGNVLDLSNIAVSGSPGGNYSTATQTIISNYFAVTDIKPVSLTEGTLFDLAAWLPGKSTIGTPLQQAGNPGIAVSADGIAVTGRNGGNYEGFDIMLMDINDQIDPALYNISVEVKGKITLVKDNTDDTITKARIVLQGTTNAYTWVASSPDYTAANALAVDDTFTVKGTLPEDYFTSHANANGRAVRIQTGAGSDRSEFIITSIVVSNDGQR